MAKHIQYIFEDGSEKIIKGDRIIATRANPESNYILAESKTKSRYIVGSRKAGKSREFSDVPKIGEMLITGSFWFKGDRKRINTRITEINDIEWEG